MMKYHYIIISFVSHNQVIVYVARSKDVTPMAFGLRYYLILLRVDQYAIALVFGIMSRGRCVRLQ